MWTKDLTPKLFTLVKEGIPGNQILRDTLSGVIVGIVALPLCIAFAIASGVSPEKGIITGIIGGLIISVFGGSRVQIGGPTGAFIVIVYGIVQTHGVEGLTLATFMAGFIILFMGIMKFGRLLKYFPFTLIVGFTSGIAVIIFSSQIKDLLGLEMGPVPSDFIEKWKEYFLNISTFNPYALGIGGLTIVTAVLFPKITNKIPGSLLAILLCSWLVYFFDLPVETIESRFGEIKGAIPNPRFYLLNFETIKALLPPAFAIAVLGSLESLLSAVVADGMIGGNHRSNMELMAQGGANVFSAMFGGIPVTGAIARTATNVKNGGRTPIAGIVHALVLLLILLAASPLAKMIPLSCLAGILVVIAWNMSELQTFRSILKSNKYDVTVLLSTFILTVVFDLVIAIEVGMGLAAFLFMKRMSDATELGELATLSGDNQPDQMFENELPEIPDYIMIYEINGPLFFGAAQKFFDTIKIIGDHHRVLIIRMRNVPIIDATGLQRLNEILKIMKHRNVLVLLSGVNNSVKQEIVKTGMLPDEFMQNTIQEALNKAGTYVNN